MALAFNNNYIIYYHMDAQWSIGLAQTYFSSPDYSVVQDWIHATFLTPDTINQTQSPVYHYTKFLMVWWVTHLWASFVILTAIISFANPTMPYVLTAYPSP